MGESSVRTTLGYEILTLCSGCLRLELDCARGVSCDEGLGEYVVIGGKCVRWDKSEHGAIVPITTLERIYIPFQS